MNILFTNSTDIYSGGEEYVLILARHLKLRGHAVTVSALPGHLLLSKCAREGIAALPLQYGNMARVFAVGKELRTHLRARSIQIVHSNANYDRTCAAIATAFTGIKHVAGIHSAHSIQFNLTHVVRNRWGIDHFITDADAGKEVLVSSDHISPDRITTVPIGFEATDMEAQAVARTRMRRTLGVPDNTVLIGNVARLVPFKGHRYLLESLSLLVRRHAGVLLCIVGDGELEGELRSQAESLGITAQVRFLGFRDDLDDLYAAFDIYCHSSLEMASEMFPLAVIRALSAGLPVITTRVGGIPLMVDEGKSGFVVPPAEPGPFAETLGHLLADPALRRSMATASRELFNLKYHAAGMAERVEHVYGSILR